MAQIASKDHEISRLTKALRESQEKVQHLTVTFKDQLARVREEQAKQGKAEAGTLVDKVNLEAMKDLMQQLDLLRKEKGQMQTTHISQIRSLRAELDKKCEEVMEKQKEFKKLEEKLKEMEREMRESRREQMGMQEKLQQAFDKNLLLEEQLQKLRSLSDTKLSKPQEDPQASRNQEVRAFITRSRFRDAEMQTDQEVDEVEYGVKDEVRRLQQERQNQDVEMISLRMTVNEQDGIIQAARAHNSALIQRVNDLAGRVEVMTRSTRAVEDLKDEFYQHCKDYVAKKRALVDANRALEDRFKADREKRDALEKELEILKEELQGVFREQERMFTEKERELRERRQVEAQKNGYKDKLRLANQRLKNMSNAMDDISLIIYQKIVNAEQSRGEMERVETIENEISTLTHLIKTREEELSHEVTFARRYLGHI